MEEQNNKNKKPLIVILVMLILLAITGVLFSTGIISFKTKEAIDTTKPTNENKKDNDDYSPWMEYLLKQNITNINLKNVTFVDGINDTSKEVTLTVEELKSIFRKIMYYAFVKYYSIGDSLTGYGDTLTISYIANEKKYDVKINDNWISCGLVKDDGSQNFDKDFLNALEDTIHSVENEEFKDEEGAYYAYIFKNYSSDLSIYDEFYK